MSQWDRPYKGQLWWVRQGLPWGSHHVSNVDNKLICWLCTAKKSTFMLMHEFMWRRIQLLSYLNGGYISSNNESAHSTREDQTNLLSTAQGTSVQVRRDKQDGVHGSALAQLGSMRRSRRRNSLEKRTRLIFPLRKAMIWATGSIVARVMTTIKGTNAITTTNNLTTVIKTIDATITLIAKTRTTRTKSPTRRRMIVSTIT